MDKGNKGGGKVVGDSGYKIPLCEYYYLSIVSRFHQSVFLLNPFLTRLDLISLQKHNFLNKFLLTKVTRRNCISSRKLEKAQYKKKDCLVEEGVRMKDERIILILLL